MGLRRLPVGSAARVSVPATSANLGPGFDALGLALELRDEVELTVVAGDDVAHVVGEGAGELPADGSHLVLRLAREHLAARGWEAPGLQLRARNRIPHARGLGSSAAAVVSALAVAEALLPEQERRTGPALLDAAARQEGHPDNVAPALLGGATVSWAVEDSAEGGPAAAGPSGAGRPPAYAAAALRVRPEVTPVVAIPDVRLSTAAARGVLPAQVPHAVAAAQAGRTALLVHALAEDPSLLLPATRDWLHQDARSGAMPASAALVAGLREAGHAAVVSGAGPTVLVLAPDAAGAREAASLAEGLTAVGGVGWRIEVPGTAREGARVEPLHHA